MPDVTPLLDWSYDTVANRYRQGSSGQFIGSAQIVALRNDFLDSRTAVVANLSTQLVDGSLTLPEWETAMQGEIRVVLGVEYVFGRGGLDLMTQADLDTLSGLVASQFGYLDEFAQAIEDGTLSEAQIAARADMYLGAGVGAYERGAAAASGIDLPEYPGDACDGKSNCRCAWQITMAEDGSVQAFWICEADVASCEPCVANGDLYNPLTF